MSINSQVRMLILYNRHTLWEQCLRKSKESSVILVFLFLMLRVTVNFEFVCVCFIV